jgi:hypothetical protein
MDTGRQFITNHRHGAPEVIGAVLILLALGRETKMTIERAIPELKTAAVAVIEFQSHANSILLRGEEIDVFRRRFRKNG